MATGLMTKTATGFGDDRRRHERCEVTKRCKVFHWPTQRYYPAELCDFSRGGCLLRVLGGRGLAPDDAVDIFVAWHGEALVRSNEEWRGRVVRRLGAGDGEQLIGVEFEAPVEARRAA